MSNKTINEYFIDWQSHVFGFGYGTGEQFTIPATALFFQTCPVEGTYDYNVLEKQLTPTVAWLLINIFCKHDLLEYGTSPRYGWLTDKGKALKEFLSTKTDNEIFAIINIDEDHNLCYPDACNCGENGYEEDRKCNNPFWR